MMINNGIYGFLFSTFNMWDKKLIKRFIEALRKDGDKKLKHFVQHKNISEYKGGSLVKSYSEKHKTVLTANEYADILQLEFYYHTSENKSKRTQK